MNTVICKLTSGIERTAEVLIGAFGTLLDKPSGEMADYPAVSSVREEEQYAHEFQAGNPRCWELPFEDPRHPQYEDWLLDEIDGS